MAQDAAAVGQRWAQDPRGCLALSRRSQPLGAPPQRWDAVGAVAPPGGRQAAVSTPGGTRLAIKDICGVLSPPNCHRGENTARVSPGATRDNESFAIVEGSA